MTLKQDYFQFSVLGTHPTHRKDRKEILHLAALRMDP